MVFARRRRPERERDARGCVVLVARARGMNTLHARALKRRASDASVDESARMTGWIQTASRAPRVGGAGGVSAHRLESHALSPPSRVIGEEIILDRSL